MEQRGSVSEGEGECKVQCGWMVSGSGVRFVNEDRDRNFTGGGSLNEVCYVYVKYRPLYISEENHESYNDGNIPIPFQIL